MMDFKVSEEKIKENNAIGINIMFGDNRVRYIKDGGEMGEDYRGKALIVINNFLSDLQLHSDIETYIMDEGVLKGLLEIMEEPGIKESVESQIDNITDGGDYFEIKGKEVVEKAMENMRNKKGRYGAYIVFETMIVRNEMAAEIKTH